MMKRTEMTLSQKKSMKRRIAKTALALTLAAGMLFGSVNLPSFAGRNAAIGAQDVLAADSVNTTDLDKLINNLKELQKSAGNLGGDGITLSGLIDGVIGGITKAASIYNSGTLFLKMAGFMKDSTSAALMNIQYTLKDMNITIQNMNTTLNNLADEIAKMDVFAQETSRAAEVRNAVNIYADFSKSYVEQLNHVMSLYEDEINDGLKAWYNDSNSSRTPIRIYYAYNNEGKLIQVYDYSDSPNPAYSVEGYAILPDQTIRLSKEAVDRAMENAPFYTIDTFRDDMIACLRAEIRAELKDGTLDAGDAFFEAWEPLSNIEKRAKLDELAEQAYNAVSSAVSKEKMEKSSLSTNAYDLFKDYCTHINDGTSALDAELTILKLTHGFEGEIKDDIEKIIDSFNVTTGVFATMTLSMMHQSGRQSSTRINEMMDAWTKCTETMENKRQTNITGHDNYCYVTNCLVNYEERTMEYKNSTTTRMVNSTVTYKDSQCTTGDLLKTGDRIMDSTWMTMLSHLDQKKDFSKYLADQNINFPASNAKNLVAEANGWSDFSPSNGIFMNYGFRADCAGEDYWGKTFQCKVNKGNDSDIEDKYFHNCKIMTGTLFNLEKNTMTRNETLAAMATYGENHWYWFRDEVYLMGYADKCDHKINIYDEEHSYDRQGSTQKMTIEDVCNFSKTYGVLVLSEQEDPEKAVLASPMAEFDSCDMIADISKIQPAVSEEHTYIDVNPDQDKSQLIEETTETMEEPIEAATEAMEEPIEATENAEPALETQEAVEHTEPVIEHADLPEVALAILQ